MVPTEDAMDALIGQLVQPLLPITMDHYHKPSISQQEAVAKQMHAVVLLYNYYHRKQYPQLEFLSLETLLKIAVNTNGTLLAYLERLVSPSQNISPVEKSIMRACNISKALWDHDARTIKMWPVEKVAVFLADVKREKCFLERDTLVKGVFSLVEIEVEGQKPEDLLGNLTLSKVESRTGINRINLRTWYSRQTYSLSKEKSRAVVFLMECSKPPVGNEFLEIPIKDVLNNLKGPVITRGPIHEQMMVVQFFLLLPYADIISDWLSKPTSELEKEQERVPFVMKDLPSCVSRLMKIRDDLCENHRKLGDKIAQCEMDIETIRDVEQMTSEVKKIVERWEKEISSKGQLDASVGCPNPNKKKKFKLRSSCQILDDNCRDNRLALPRYNVHPISNGLYMASATLKGKGVDCMADSDLKKNPHEAREHAALRLMQKLHEMEED